MKYIVGLTILLFGLVPIACAKHAPPKAVPLRHARATAPIVWKMISSSGDARGWWTTDNSNKPYWVPLRKELIKGVPASFQLQFYLDDQARHGISPARIPAGTYGPLEGPVWLTDCSYIQKGTTVVADADASIAPGTCSVRPGRILVGPRTTTLGSLISGDGDAHRDKQEEEGQPFPALPALIGGFLFFVIGSELLRRAVKRADYLYVVLVLLAVPFIGTAVFLFLDVVGIFP